MDRKVVGMDESGGPPEWLRGPAEAVLDDLQSSQPIESLHIVATQIPDLNGLSLELAEPPRVTMKLPQLPDDLDPDEPTSYGGGNWVPRSLTGARLLVLIADILQESLAETSVAWGQARPPCPSHSHPAAPVLRDREAWWVCRSARTPLYRIGRGEVSAKLAPSRFGPKESRRARKRRHH